MLSWNYVHWSIIFSNVTLAAQKYDKLILTSVHCASANFSLCIFIVRERRRSDKGNFNISVYV